MSVFQYMKIIRVRHAWALVLAIALCGIGIYACIRDAPSEESRPLKIALDWNRFMLSAEMSTEGYRGPVAARTYAYVGFAAYEAALPGFNGEFRSLRDLYPGLRLPSSEFMNNFQMTAALNACYYTMLDLFFAASPEKIRSEKRELNRKWEELIKGQMNAAEYDQARQYGINVARAVYAWSATDSLGYRANHHNYDRQYKAPVGPGLWITSDDFPMPPLLPYWGKVRPFVINTEQYLAEPLPDYATSPDFYKKQAIEILTLSQPLSVENQWIADFWNDDRPGLSFTPAGHWLAITNQVIEKENPTIEKALETYLKVGIALSDAIIACWYSKYHYNIERPETYIRKHLSDTWRPYSPTPSFPSYPSGHSMMGAAAAEVLTDAFGDNYDLMDCSHKDLPSFETKPRKFKSFKEMARENALSRMLLGVHFRMDCNEGLRLGELIGQEVTQLKLESKLTE